MCAKNIKNKNTILLWKTAHLARCLQPPAKFSATSFVETSTCCNRNETKWILHLAFTHRLGWCTQMLSESLWHHKGLILNLERYKGFVLFRNSPLRHLINSWSDCRHLIQTSVLQHGHLHVCSVVHQVPLTTVLEVKLLERLNYKRCHWAVSVLHKLEGLVQSPGPSCQFTCTILRGT